MQRNRKSMVLVIITTLMLVLAGCADDGTKESDKDTEEKKQGGDLVIAESADAVSLDPAGSNDVPSSKVQENIYERLLIQDESLELKPGLATEWEAVEDNVWEFKLREGVKFHDGEDFNAEVVKANIDRVIDEKVASPRAFLYAMIKEIRVVDDYTVQFETEFPFAPLPSHLAHSGGGMVSPAVIEEDYAQIEKGEEPGSYINENPVGTGFFKFEEWIPGESITLVRNDDYWGENALLDSVTFKVVEEDLTRVAELKTEDTHIADPLSPSDISEVESVDGLSVIKTPSVRLNYIGFNEEKEPFNDPKVRQALNMAIDKNQIIDGIYEGIGIPATGPLAPDVFGYDESIKGLEYEPEKAKELLKEAGLEDGFEAKLWTDDKRTSIDTATNIQAQLKDYNIDVQIEQFEWGAYLDKTGNGEHEMFVLGWSVVTGDADYGLHPLFHSENLGVPGNRTFTQDEELDKLLDAAREESDEKERLALYSEIQEKLNELAPMLYLQHPESVLAVSDKVKGLKVLPTDMFSLHEVYLEE